MRSYISSSNLKLLAFPATVAALFAALGLYCQYSQAFQKLEQLDIAKFVHAPGNLIAFGDSQIGGTSKIPGYDFFAFGGMQTVEFKRLVHYLYRDRRPKRVIIEMAPQWFGEYHRKRKPFLSDKALPPFGILILSSIYYEDLKDHFLTKLESAFDLKAFAGEYSAPRSQAVADYSTKWTETIKSKGAAFDWSQFPPEGRRVLTLARAYSQNPQQGFESSRMAADLEEGIDYLASQGAEICFYEPPVTDDLRKVRPLIDDSRYAAFDTYAAALAEKYGVRWVRNIVTLTDGDFNNQDHLHIQRGMPKVWPLVEGACFAAAAANQGA